MTFRNTKVKVTPPVAGTALTMRTVMELVVAQLTCVLHQLTLGRDYHSTNI